MFSKNLNQKKAGSAELHQAEEPKSVKWNLYNISLKRFCFPLGF